MFETIARKFRPNFPSGEKSLIYFAKAFRRSPKFHDCAEIIQEKSKISNASISL